MAEILSKNPEAPKQASKAAKKGQAHSANLYKRTRLAKELQPGHPSVAKFNLQNFGKAVDLDAIKYQFSKFAELSTAQFERIDLPLKKRAAAVGALIKSFQLCGVFAYVDSAIFTAADNLVSYLEIIILENYLVIIKISLEYVDTRDFNLDQKRLKKWAKQQPFPGSFYVEMAREVENELTSPEATQEADKSKSLFSDPAASESSGKK